MSLLFLPDFLVPENLLWRLIRSMQRDRGVIWSRLSSYARQFLGQMEKPDVESIEGLPPAISIDQKSTNRNPRSTVGTVTEIYDYFRLLYARVGIPTLSEVRQRDQKTDGRSDGRCRSCSCRSVPKYSCWHRLYVDRKANACEVAGKSEKEWLCTCADRRQSCMNCREEIAAGEKYQA